MVTDALQDIWDRMTTAGAAPSGLLLALTAGVALLVVAWRPAWGVARHGLTIVHEASHALAALVSGRSLSGIRLHSDTSGLTVSRGKPRGPGMVLTAFAGYVGPALLGLGAAALLGQRYAAGLLWALVVVLALMLVQIRNWFGLWSVMVSGVALVAVSWWGSDVVVTAAAYLVTFVLLLGAPRAVVELQSERRRRRTGTSDADMLARLTPFPGTFWVVVFLAVTAGCLALGGWWVASDALGEGWFGALTAGL